MTDGDTSSVVVNPHYKLILISVIVTFFICLIALPAIAMTIHEPTELQEQVIGLLDFVLKSTLGAMLGLLGAKVTS